MVDKQSLEFLWNCSVILSTRTHTERLLKSYYITTCRKLANRNVQLPTNYFGSGQMCSRCGNQWCDGNFHLHLKPVSVSKTAKRRQQVAKLEVQQPRAQETPTLSRGAKKRAKWLKKHMSSNVVVDCSLCRHKTTLTLEKPRNKLVQVKQATIGAKQDATMIKINKNKKGQKQKNHPNPTAKKTSGRPGSATKHNEKGNAAATPPPPPSKTQKKNALLKLAAQLKAHALKDSSRPQQNRLQALLK